MKSNKNKEPNTKRGSKPTIVKNIKPRKQYPQSLPITDDLVMYLYDAGDYRNQYARVDFNDYSTFKDFCMIMDRSKLKEMADLIYTYLDNNQ